MGQKSNPISLRLEKTNQHWSNCWYADFNYATQFLQDCRINAYFQNCNQQWKKIPPILSLKHQRGQLQIALFSPRPVLNPIKGGSTNRSRAPSRRGWDKEKRKRVHTLNAHFSASSNMARKVLQLKGPAVEQVPSKNTLWMGVRALLFAAKLGIIYQHQFLPNHAQRGMPRVDILPLSPVSSLGVSFPFFWGERGGISSNKHPEMSFHRKNTRPPSLGLGAPLKKRFELSLAAVNKVQSSVVTYRCKIHLFKGLSTFQSPFFVASKLVFLLQERKTFRQLKLRLITELIQEVEKNAYIKGMRITCSGRVAARSKKAQKARTESIQWGETGLNVLSESVGFASKSAQTTYGKLGIKVWVCYSARGMRNKR